MSLSFGRNALREYQQAQNAAAIGGFSPNQLVQMLREGAEKGIAMAKGHLLRSETAQKGEQISRVIGILEGLRASLNMEAGGDIALRLDALYDYMERRLLYANLHNDSGALDEVARLLSEIKGAWDTITSTPPRAESQAQGVLVAG